VSLYPNPTSENLYLDLTESVISAPLNHLAVNCEIYNSLGQLVKVVIAHNELNVIDVSEFASGNYIVKIVGDNEKFSLEFEKE